MPEAQDPRTRAAALVARLTLPERARLVSGRDSWTTAAVGGLPSRRMADGPNGVRRELPDGPEGFRGSSPATCFPSAAVLGATWDPILLAELGEAMGREARAQGIDVLLAPGVNIKRHPLGGRNFEYLSEDPVLSGELGAALVGGIQLTGVGACVKHFAVNNQESRRMSIDAIVDEKTMRELYLRAFEIVLAKSAPAAVMTAYNRVNGDYCSESPTLVRRILRGEWGYEGLVTSDWGGTNDRIAGLNVGVDLEMPGTRLFNDAIVNAVKSGQLHESQLNLAATRVAELASTASPRRVAGSEGVDAEAHHALARRTAAAGTVLLRNEGILPLAGKGRLAVVGAFAHAPRIQGGGSSRVRPTRIDTLLDSLRAAWDGEVSYAPGYETRFGGTRPDLIAAAEAVAGAADTTILVLGQPEGSEAEGRDRSSGRLPEGQERLLVRILEASARVVVVLVGGIVELDWADEPEALLHAGLGGQAAGSALADILLGVQEPGGRLAESIPFRFDDLPASANFPGGPNQVEYREGPLVGYRFHDTAGVPARFPFGHGLTYTGFAWEWPRVHGIGTDRVVSVLVRNTGKRAGSEVVQVYLRRRASLVWGPEKELKGFERIHLAPGESGRVRITLDRRSFTVWDPVQQAWVVEAGEYEVALGASAADIRCTLRLIVDSRERVTPRRGPRGNLADDWEFATMLGRAVPVPPSVRPFEMSTPIADLRLTWRGLLLRSLLRLGTRVRSLARTGGLDLRSALEALDDLPLRGLVQNAGLPLSLGGLRSLAAWLDRGPETPRFLSERRPNRSPVPLAPGARWRAVSLGTGAAFRLASATARTAVRLGIVVAARALARISVLLAALRRGLAVAARGSGEGIARGARGAALLARGIGHAGARAALAVGRLVVGAWRWLVGVVLVLARELAALTGRARRTLVASSRTAAVGARAVSRTAAQRADHAATEISRQAERAAIDIAARAEQAAGGIAKGADKAARSVLRDRGRRGRLISKPETPEDSDGLGARGDDVAAELRRVARVITRREPRP